MTSNRQRGQLGAATGLLGLVSAVLLGCGLGLAFEHRDPTGYLVVLLAVGLRVVGFSVSSSVTARRRQQSAVTLQARVDALSTTPGATSVASLDAAARSVELGDDLADLRAAASVAFIGIIPLGLLVGWWSVLVFVALFALAVPAYVKAGRATERLSVLYEQRRASLAAEQLRVLRAMPDLQGLGAVNYATNQIDAVSRAERDVIMKMLRVAMTSSLVTDFLTGVSVGLVAMLVGFQLLRGSNALPAGLAGLFITTEMAGRWRAWASAFHRRSDAERGSDVLMHAGEQRPRDHAAFSLNAVELRTAAPARPVTFSLRSADRLVITGPSGVGKSTLVDTILGIATPIDGSLTVDLPRVALVRPGSSIADGPLVDYLTDGDGDLAARATDVLRALGLTFTLDHVITGNGVNVSDGERARLILARGLVCGATVIVLDDVTSLLDESARTSVARALPSDATVIEVTHGLPLVAPTHTLTLECA